nr:alpha/beta fold hydrolase [Methylocella silvestris]
MKPDGIIAALAFTAIVVALTHLFGFRADLDVERTSVAGTPVTIFRKAGDGPAPAAVIAHGFSGSQQLMEPFAETLAQNGYVTVTFDFLGHGRNPAALPGGLTDQEASMRALLAELGAVADFARRLPASDGRLAVLGHSMAADIVVRYANENPAVAATVALSMFSPEASARSRNLLAITGALEPGALKEEALRVARDAAPGAAKERVTYGDFADGSARRIAFAHGVEHIGVLYSAESMTEALSWLNAAFARHGSGFIEARGAWLGLLFLGLVLLARPLTRLLPQVATSPVGRGLRGRAFALAAIAPAALTPLILWKAPTAFLPLLLGDYLLLHFGLYGLLTAGALALAPAPAKTPSGGVIVSKARLALAAALVAAYACGAIGLAFDRFVTAFFPLGGAPLALALACGTLPFFIADEYLTRGLAAPRFAYALTKICFLISLALAIALNPARLFFLIIIAPVILIFFVIFGLISGWTYRQTNHPLPGALALAAAFAMAIAAVFPVVSP